MAKQITVLAGIDQNYLETQGAEAEEHHFDTIAAAKKRAKYFLTEKYQDACESSVRLTYAKVLVNGECVADFFLKPTEKKLQ